jgi:hypothetical protein
MVLCFLIWSSLFFIANFFLGLFVKVMNSFQFHHLIITLFLFFISILSLILKKKIPCTKLILFFNFTIQLNIKFILYFKFDLYSFNFYFLKSFCVIEIIFLVSSFNI